MRIFGTIEERLEFVKRSLLEYLKFKIVMVCGQILPGIPVWKACEESRWAGMADIVFPGNVGDSNKLITVVDKLN